MTYIYDLDCGVLLRQINVDMVHYFNRLILFFNIHIHILQSGGIECEKIEKQ